MSDVEKRSNVKDNLITRVMPVIILLAIFWIVLIIDSIMTLSLTKYGIVPRTGMGLWGIIFSPFLHGGFGHLISNSLPFFFLASTAMIFYRKSTPKAMIFIILVGGFLVWLFARSASHVGASGLIFGLITFLMLSGIFRRDAKSILISIIILFSYGGSLIIGVIPTQKGVSWEGHLFGGIAGILAAYIFRRKND
ncbi:MAG: rhomboid family intramembrane serine protease [Spirochaetota bacterium]|nr:rhomboid family intramembrane serine protease [Spirochaetota bacterium]